MRQKRSALAIAGTIIMMIAILNFIVFWIVAVSIGGNAFSGKVVSGHYFVSSHGELTEVSPIVWRYSLIHTASVWVTHPLGMLVGGTFIWGNQRSKQAA